MSGEQVCISIGLGNFGIRNLYSYPLLKVLKAMVMFDSGTLVISNLGTSFKLVIKRPKLVAISPTAGEGIPLALFFATTHTSAARNYISSNLTDAFQILAIEDELPFQEEPGI